MKLAKKLTSSIVSMQNLVYDPQLMQFRKGPMFLLRATHFDRQSEAKFLWPVRVSNPRPSRY